MTRRDIRPAVGRPIGAASPPTWRRLLLAAMIAGSAFAGLFAGTARAQPAGAERAAPPGLRQINVGFVRHAIGAWMTRVADGGFESDTGRTIRFQPHDTDSSIAVAMASGRLDIGLIGAGVAAASIVRGLDLRLFYVMGSSPDSEGLMIGPGVSLKPGDGKALHGKVVAVPFGSTPHLRLLESLRRWGGNLSSIRIVNLQTSQIKDAWLRGELDAATASEPLLGELTGRGERVPLATGAEQTGLMVLAAPAEFVGQHIVFLSRFLDVIARADRALGKNLPGLTPDHPGVVAIAALTGLPTTSIAGSIGRYRPPRLDEQASPTWLGGGQAAGLVAHLKSVIEVWRWAGRLPAGDPDLAAAIALEPVLMALGYEKR